MALPFHFRCFGLRFASDLPFPDLPEAIEPAVAVDVRIRLGETPTSLPRARRLQRHRQHWEGRTSECLLTIGDRLRYHVVGGQSITVQAAPDAHPDYVRLFLFGSAMGALLHQRGFLPLHGSAVRMPDGRAAVLLGRSGAGKSTLAAALGQRGHAPLSDDISPVRLDAGGGLWLDPGLPQHKLWQQTLARLDLKPSVRRQAQPSVEKYWLPVAAPVLTPVPLGRLYVVEQTDSAAVAMVPLAGNARLNALIQHTYRPDFSRLLGQNDDYLRLVAAVDRGGVPIGRLRRPTAGWSLSECVARIESDWDAEESA